MTVLETLVFLMSIAVIVLFLTIFYTGARDSISPYSGKEFYRSHNNKKGKPMKEVIRKKCPYCQYINKVVYGSIEGNNACQNCGEPLEEKTRERYKSKNQNHSTSSGSTHHSNDRGNSDNSSEKRGEYEGVLGEGPLSLGKEDIQKILKDLNPALYKFSHVPGNSLENLAYMAEEEPGNWHSTDEHRGILKYYIFHTFRRAIEQFKEEEYEGFHYDDKGEYGKTLVFSKHEYPKMAFDTGLITERFEPIYGIFSKYEGYKKAYLDGFYLKDYLVNKKSFHDSPKMVSYYKEPSALIWDHRKGWDWNADHILGNLGKGEEGRAYRFPKSIRGMSQNQQKNQIEGSIRDSIEIAKRNYKIVIPQYYVPYGYKPGKLQLLLPLFLEGVNNKADLAIAFEEKPNYYIATTILTLEWAYKNARAIARPDRYWLHTDNFKV